MDGTAAARVVVDNGTSVMRVGWAEDCSPRAAFPNLVGKIRLGKGIMEGVGWSDYYVGDAAQWVRSLLSLSYPIQRGVVTNWDAMEQVWHHIFYNELRIAPEEHPILMTELPFNPRRNREMMTQTMFETFNAGAFYVATPPRLRKISSARATGMVVSIGEGTIIGVPFVDGHEISSAAFRVSFGGKDLTDYLATLLQESGQYTSIIGERAAVTPGWEMIKDMKEKLCYTAVDFAEETETAKSSLRLQRSYELPDGQVLTLNDERFRCAEALFDPSLLGMETPGLHRLIDKAIKKSPIDARKAIYGNILMEGATAFMGLNDRLQKEMETLVNDRVKVRIDMPGFNRLETFVGGCFLATTADMARHWIPKEAYEEVGPSITRRCKF